MWICFVTAWEMYTFCCLERPTCIFHCGFPCEQLFIYSLLILWRHFWLNLRQNTFGSHHQYCTLIRDIQSIIFKIHNMLYKSHKPKGQRGSGTDICEANSNIFLFSCWTEANSFRKFAMGQWSLHFLFINLFKIHTKCSLSYNLWIYTSTIQSLGSIERFSTKMWSGKIV